MGKKESKRMQLGHSILPYRCNCQLMQSMIIMIDRISLCKSSELQAVPH